MSKNPKDFFGTKSTDNKTIFSGSYHVLELFKNLAGVEDLHQSKEIAGVNDDRKDGWFDNAVNKIEKSCSRFAKRD